MIKILNYVDIYVDKIVSKGCGCMINQLFMIGTIKYMPCNDKESNDNYFVLEVRRGYKNATGTYDKDCFKCHLWIAISQKINRYCKVGDLVAVKGRLVDSLGECNILVEQAILLNKTFVNC